jgi:hypothetical protein
MWATLIQTVAAALRTALPTVIVETVADAPAPDEDTVYVLRSGSAEPSFFAERGVENLILECWTRDPVPATADLKLQTLENNAVAALRGLPHSGPIVSLSLTSIESDGDIYRPNVGSRIYLTLNWRETPV